MVYEGAFPASNAGAFRRYIGGVAIATFYQATGIDQTRYQHTDHLGSVTALSDEGGQIAAQMAFDPWGQRRNGNDWNTVWQQWTMGMTPVWAQSAIDITPRGYTGHEHVDEMGIIHMNGRIYDALLGRFLQADPFVEDSTTLNRYTYVHNNPLSLTDPSGFFSFKKAFRTIASVGVAVAAGILTAGASTTLQGFLYATLGGALSGGIAAGSIEGALWGAFAGAVFFGIGQHFAVAAEANSQFAQLGWVDPATISTTTGLTARQMAFQTLSHGLAGGTISKLQGGNFGHGFFSAGVAKAATPGIAGSSLNTFQKGFALSIVGGTTSKISGGKFANGATTAAMAFAFNQMTQREAKQTAEQLNNSRGPHKWTAVQLEDGTWNVMSPEDAARRAAGLPTDSNMSGQAGGSFHAFGGVIGTSVSWRNGFDSAGNMCSTTEWCLQFGAGLSFGAGPSFSSSASRFVPGRTEGFGAFGNFGKGVLGGASVDLAAPGGSADVRARLGAGASGGIQWCIAETQC